jgi:hypothetical protein
MLAAFSKKHSRWPLVLDAYVPCADQGWGSGDRLSCRCANAIADTDGRPAGPPTVPFLRRANFDDGLPAAIASTPELPRWVELPRQMAELLVTFGGSSEGTWLLRELTIDRVGLCVLYQGSPSHHLIHRTERGVCELNGAQTPHQSIDAVLEELQERPAALQWPIRLDPALFVRPWLVGNVVSAPYSADGNFYDGIIVDIFPSGNFRNIPVNLARVSYVGYASENDDCVPINQLQPPTGVENPDFYTPGGLSSAVQSGLFQLGEDTDARKRRLALLHAEAMAREVVVDLTTADAGKLVLDSAGRGAFVVEVSGDLTTGKAVYPGMQVIRVENTDTEAASPDLVRALLKHCEPSCEVAFKVNPPLFAEVVQKRSPQQGPTPTTVVESANGDVMIAVNPTFEVPSGIVYTVPSDVKSHGLKWLAAADNAGCYVRSVKVGSAGDGVVSEGLRLSRIGDVDAFSMIKSDVVQAIRKSRKRDGNSVTLVFTEDTEGYALAIEVDAARSAAESLPDPPTRTSRPATVDVLMSGGSKLGITFIGGRAGSYVTKVSTGGAADKSGLVTIGLRLLKINGDDVTEASKDVRNTAIKQAQATGQVLMTFTDDAEGFDHAKRAHAEAKAAKVAAPPAALAATVDVTFSEQVKLGLSFINREGHGNWVSKVKPGSPAEAKGKITVGLKLLAVNGVDVSTATKADRNDAIKLGWATGELTLTFGKDLEGYKVALDAQTAATGSNSTSAAKNQVKVVFAKQVKLGLTFATVDGRGSFITKMKPGLAAEGSKLIKIGQRLLKVNSVDVSVATGAARTAAIKEAWASGGLTLVLCDDEPGFKLALQQKEHDEIAAKSNEKKKERKSSKKSSKKGSSKREKVSAKSKPEMGAATVKPAKGSAKAQAGSPPPPAGQTVCVYKNIAAGRACTRIALPSGTLCSAHLCPSCGKAKGSRDPTCLDCAGKSRGKAAPSSPPSTKKPSSTGVKNQYLDMDRREVMKLLREANVKYDRTASLETLAEIAHQSIST